MLCVGRWERGCQFNGISHGLDRMSRIVCVACSYMGYKVETSIWVNGVEYEEDNLCDIKSATVSKFLFPNLSFG